MRVSLLLLASIAAASLLSPAFTRPPTGSSTPRLIIPDTMFFAEGLDVDARDGSLYITSVYHRNVFRLRGAGSSPEPVMREGKSSVAAVLGVRVDTLRGLIWATTAKLPTMRSAETYAGPAAELLRIELGSGAISARWPLGDSTSIPGELALAPDGSVLISDGTRGLLYRLRPGAESLETVSSALLKSPQGIAVHPSGELAWVADWSRGILRWDLQSDSIESVSTASGASVRGVDGLLRLGDGSLVGVQNGARVPRIVQIVLANGGRRISDAQVIDETPAYEGEPTVGALHGNHYLFVASSAWPFWDVNGARRDAGRPLPPVVIRELRLEPR